MLLHARHPQPKRLRLHTEHSLNQRAFVNRANLATAMAGLDTKYLIVTLVHSFVLVGIQ